MIVTLDQKGGVVLPPEYLKQLGLKPGDNVEIALEKNEIRIALTRGDAVKRAQALIRQYVPEGRSLSEELIRERREMDCE